MVIPVANLETRILILHRRRRVVSDVSSLPCRLSRILTRFTLPESSPSCLHILIKPMSIIIFSSTQSLYPINPSTYLQSISHQHAFSTPIRIGPSTGRSRRSSWPASDVLHASIKHQARRAFTTRRRRAVHSWVYNTAN